MNELQEMIEFCEFLIREMDWLEDVAKEWGDTYGNAVE